MPHAIGDALAKAITEAAQEGKQFEVADEGDTRLILCALSSHREPNQKGKLTLSAAQREHGYIILGPVASRPSEGATMEDMLRHTQVRRWVLNEVPLAARRKDIDAIMESELSEAEKHRQVQILKSTLRGSPSVVLASKVRITCPECGFSSVMWRDDARREKDRHGDDWPVCKCQLAKAAAAAQAGLEAPALVKGVETVMRVELFNPTNDPNVDAIFADVNDTSVLDNMFKQWKEGVPKNGQPNVDLPRVWCVYDKASMPNLTWCPSDASAQLLAAKAADYAENVKEGDQLVRRPKPLGILPFGMAKKFHLPPDPENKALQACWLEVPDLDVGWVRIKDLFENPDGGFKRHMWYETAPKARTGKPRQKRDKMPVV